jgi:hypothetical protein
MVDSCNIGSQWLIVRVFYALAYFMMLNTVNLAGLLRLPFGTLLHHNNVRIGLAPSVNVTSLSFIKSNPH